MLHAIAEFYKQHETVAHNVAAQSCGSDMHATLHLPVQRTSDVYTHAVAQLSLQYIKALSSFTTAKAANSNLLMTTKSCRWLLLVPHLPCLLATYYLVDAVVS